MLMILGIDVIEMSIKSRPPQTLFQILPSSSAALFLLNFFFYLNQIKCNQTLKGLFFLIKKVNKNSNEKERNFHAQGRQYILRLKWKGWRERWILTWSWVLPRVVASWKAGSGRAAKVTEKHRTSAMMRKDANFDMFFAYFLATMLLKALRHTVVMGLGMLSSRLQQFIAEMMTESNA